jgi:MYXO-CTERM domain-containing protein
MPRERRLLSAVVLLVIVQSGAAWAQSPVQETRRRPPPLEPAPECALWKGTVSGNDPSVEIEMKLCPSGNAVSGMMQWSSLKSGWNRRAIEGRWSEDKSALTLRDTSVVESRPEPGWRFCVVDQYDLKVVSPGNLEGTYRSSACNDNAKVKLQLEPGTVPAVTPTAPPPPVEPPAVAPPPHETKRGFCSAGGPSEGTPWPLLALGGVLITAWFRRRTAAR